MTWPMPVISVATPAPSFVLSLNVAGSVFSTLTCSGSRREMKLERVGEQLDASGTRFLGHSGKGAGPDGISNIFSWFADDFAGSHGSVEEFVAAYREGGDADVDYDALLEYDWSLNVAE